MFPPVCWHVDEDSATHTWSSDDNVLKLLAVVQWKQEGQPGLARGDFQRLCSIARLSHSCCSSAYTGADAHLCMLPTVNRYSQLLDAVRRSEKGKDGTMNEGGAHGMSRAAWLLVDTSMAQLLDDNFAGDAVRFAVLQV